MRFGGIDLGGSKIEARVFGPDMSELARQRTPTPRGGYDALLDALAGQVAWLVRYQAAGIGLGVPGLVDPQDGSVRAANLPLSGAPLARDLRNRTGRDICILNDARAAALSEALCGAGTGFACVLTVIFGTGVSAACVVDGRLMPGLNGHAAEVGHLPLPAALVRDLGLPLMGCTCGRCGCFETLLSGPGLARLVGHATGRIVVPADLPAGQVPEPALEIWRRIAASLFSHLLHVFDPQVVVVAGGLGVGLDLAAHLRTGEGVSLLAGARLPEVRTAAKGDASGALGAALWAAQERGG